MGYGMRLLKFVREAPYRASTLLPNKIDIWRIFRKSPPKLEEVEEAVKSWETSEVKRQEHGVCDLPDGVAYMVKMGASTPSLLSIDDSMVIDEGGFLQRHQLPETSTFYKDTSPWRSLAETTFRWHQPKSMPRSFVIYATRCLAHFLEKIR